MHTLQRAPRVAASPRAVAYLSRNIAFNGHISVPVLTMHTTGDGLVVPEDEQAYQSVVDRAGRGNLLRQVFMDRAGYRAFTPAETITVVQVLLNRLHTGYWNAPSPTTMNAQATALGPDYHIYSVDGQVEAAAAAFTRTSGTSTSARSTCCSSIRGPGLSPHIERHSLARRPSQLPGCQGSR